MASGSQSPLWRLTAKRAAVIVPLGGGGDAAPFYCVHSIGGEVTSLRPLAKELGTDRRVYGIQVPREKFGDAFATSVHAIATYYVDLLTAGQPEGPILLGGWSAGSFIALEMAQILRLRGREVPLLIVLDGYQLRCGTSRNVWHPLYYWKIAQNLPHWIAYKVSEGLGGRGVAFRITQELKRIIAAVFSLERNLQPLSMVDLFLDTSVLPPDQAAFAKSLFEAVERYEPKPYSGRVLVYVAKTQPFFSPEQVEITWRSIAKTIATVRVSGSHTTMIREPRVGALASHLRPRLATLSLAAERGAEKPTRANPKIQDLPLGNRQEAD